MTFEEFCARRLADRLADQFVMDVLTKGDDMSKSTQQCACQPRADEPAFQPGDQVKLHSYLLLPAIVLYSERTGHNGKLIYRCRWFDAQHRAREAHFYDFEMTRPYRRDQDEE